MSSSLLGILSFVAWFIFAVPTLIVLLRVFERTQIRAFLWLIAALLAWPLLARGIGFVLPIVAMRFVQSHYDSSSAMTTFYFVFYTVEALIGGGLLLTAVILLERELTARMNPAPPPPAYQTPHPQ